MICESCGKRLSQYNYGGKIQHSFADIRSYCDECYLIEARAHNKRLFNQELTTFLSFVFLFGILPLLAYVFYIVFLGGWRTI